MIYEPLSEAECYLFALTQDESGLDLAEFCLIDDTRPDGIFRAWPFQVSWWRNTENKTIDAGARSVGKSRSISLRAFAFPFIHPGNEMVITAPEAIHLQAVTDNIEILYTRNKLAREMLQGRIKHRPFHVNFANGARMMGRIPHHDGTGVKGIHPIWLEHDEAQDYGEAGWTEITSTVKDHPDSRWRCVAENQYVLTDNGWKYIQDIEVGDMVWTHKNRWKKVLNVFDNGVQDCVETVGHYFGSLVTTVDHKFYVRKKISDEFFSNPEWLAVRDFGPTEGRDLCWSSPFSLGVRDPEVCRIEDELFWTPVIRIEDYGREHVYDLEVEDDHSYCVEGIIVSNCHGVTRGVGDSFDDKITGQDSTWNVTRIPATYRPTWNETQREQAIEEYGGYDSPDFRRNILGLPGDGNSPMFVLHRIMQCFTEDTLVSLVRNTEDGDLIELVELSGVNIGDKVLNGSSDGSGEVVNVIKSKHTKICEITFGDDIIHVTPEHRFFTKRGWIEAGNLTEQDSIFTEEGVRALRNGDFESGEEGLSQRLLVCLNQGYGQINRISNCHIFRESHGKICMAHFQRMDSFKILSQGDPEFDRLSGGKDYVNCIDLTVSGHPSFFVGNNTLMVHNCVDDDVLSDYNKFEYYSELIDEAMVREVDSIEDLIEIPATHRNYERVWVGMDLGWTVAPTAITIFAEVNDGKKAKSSLKLVTKLLLRRVAPEDQVKVVMNLMEMYRPVAFTLDATGAGFPLIDNLKEKVKGHEDLAFMLDRIKPAGFSEKVIVGFDDNVKINELDPAGFMAAAIKRPYIEASTDAVRVLIDEKRMILPYDKSIIGELQSTPKNARSGVDHYGKTTRRKQGMHTLDAMRMACLSHQTHFVDEIIASHDQLWTPPDMIIF